MSEPFVIARTAGGDPIEFLPALANRHGLITGATGTGKTVSLQVLAENLSRIGVPVFVADVKGDLSGIGADYAYFRLRDEGYTPDDIARWADTIARETASCRDVFVYFKHEEEGKGPEFARLLMDRLQL